MVQRRAMLTMADQYKVAYDLLNSATFNDLERLLPPVSRSRHFWRWISQKRYDIQTLFQWKTDMDLHTPYSTVSIRI